MPPRPRRRQRAGLDPLRGAAWASAGCWPVSLALGAAGADAASAALALAFAATAPGLAATLLLGRPRADGAPALALRALALAPLAWVTVTLACAWLLGTGPAGAAPVAAWLAAAVLAGAAVRVSPDRAPGAPTPARWTALVSLAPLALLLALVAWVVAPVGVRFSYHGYLHAGIVAQLASGLVPPENPALAGEPIGFYWLYHWLLATQAALGRVSVLEVSPCVNAVALVVYVGSAQRVLRRFLPPVEAALAALAAGVAGDLLFPAIFGLRTLAAPAPSAPPFWPFEVLAHGGLGGDPRPLPLFGKFLNLGGVALGLGLWAALVAELAPRLDPEERAPARRAAHGPRRAVVFLELASLVVFHLTTAAAAYAALPAGLLAAALVAPVTPAGGSRARLAARLRTLVPAAAVFAAALAATAPFVLSVTLGTHAVGGGPPLALRPSVLLYNVRTALPGGAPLLVLSVLGLALARRDPLAVFLAAATATSLALAVALHLPDNNQYKLVLVAALPGGLLGLLLLSRAPAGARRAAVAGAAALAWAGVGIALAAYRGSIMAARTSPVGDGLYLTLPADPELDGALRWLRAHAPADAVVVGRPTPFGGSPIAAVSGRGPFLLLGGHHTAHHPEAPHRLALVRALFGDGAGGAGARHPSVVLRALRADLDRPLYVLLLRSQYGERIGALRRRFAEAPESLSPVLETPDVSLYAVSEPDPGTR